MRLIDGQRQDEQSLYPKSVAPEQIQAAPSQPVVERQEVGLRLPGRDEMLMQNILRARSPINQPQRQEVQMAAPTFATVEQREVPDERVIAPKEGAMRLIKDPRTGKDLIQYFTGIEDLGWQSERALADYVARTQGEAAAPQGVRSAQSAAEAIRETPVPSKPEKAEQAKKMMFGQKVGNRLYAGEDYGLQTPESFRKVAAKKTEENYKNALRAVVNFFTPKSTGQPPMLNR